MRKRLAVIINPTAGRGRAIVVGREVREQLDAAGHHVIDVSGATAAAADKKLRTATAELKLDAVIAVGGDGLVNLAATAVINTRIPLAIIPAGTGDDIARGLGISRRPHRNIAALVRALETDQIPTRPVDVGVAREIPPMDVDRGWESRAGEVGSARTGRDLGEREGQATRYFLSVMTGGLDATVNARANAMRFPRGQARYFFALLAELRHYRSYAYQLKIDGKESRRELILACVANLGYFGGGMKIAPGAKSDSGQLQAILVNRVSIMRLLWIFPRIFWGGHVTHPAVEVVTAREIEIQPAPGQQLPTPFADGEPVAHPPVACAVKSGALQVIKLG